MGDLFWGEGLIEDLCMCLILIYRGTPKCMHYHVRASNDRILHNNDCDDSVRILDFIGGQLPLPGALSFRGRE